MARKKPLRIYLWHGRRDPEDDLNGCGFVLPMIIDGVTMVSSTYGKIEVRFETPETAAKARELTGWDYGKDSTTYLEIPFVNDLVKCLYPYPTHNTSEPFTAYYGDWNVVMTDYPYP
jgi:hypothetical protein